MNNIAVVTGGTKGMGKAIAIKFAENGFDVAVCARTAADLDTVKQEIETKYNVKAYTFQADISKKEEAKKFVAYVKEQPGVVTVLVNNTGTYVPGQIHMEEEGVLEQMIGVNLYSAYYVTRGFVHDMKAMKSGHIFNICSTASFTAYVNGGAYCISKFAVLGMTRVLREEMKEHQVKVTAVMPGATYTSSWEGSDLPFERLMPPEDIATVIWNAYQMSPSTVVEEIIMRPQLGDIV